MTYLYIWYSVNFRLNYIYNNCNMCLLKDLLIRDNTFYSKFIIITFILEHCEPSYYEHLVFSSQRGLGIRQLSLIMIIQCG